MGMADERTRAGTSETTQMNRWPRSTRQRAYDRNEYPSIAPCALLGLYAPPQPIGPVPAARN